MRTGFTTGACAQAGVKASLEALLAGSFGDSVSVRLPNGKEAQFQIFRKISLRLEGVCGAACSIIKDGGDDPDCTHGAEIEVEVVLDEGGAVAFAAGEGVGKITKPGLSLAVGEPAINPVPRRFMEKEFQNAKKNIEKKFGFQNPGVIIRISIADGVERSKKTLNERLGIVGGLSILGTKGIVVPFSTAAYRSSISQAMDVAKARGLETIVLTTGGQSEGFAMKLYPNIPAEGFIQIGDFTGFSVKEAGKKKFSKIVMAGFLGKFSKLAKGVTQTHAAGSQVDLEFLAAVAKETGSNEKICQEIRSANTARHVGEILEREGNQEFFTSLCRKIIKHIEKLTPHPENIEVLLTNFEGKLVGSAHNHSEGR
ncbi:MAG: cobalt-precorrin-5B (C(1))-methyltransferase [Nitrospiraceae bacterium]|jgi:cobalt-precorrin-5B (C1)-methyltransferase|nr:cobalt-precorrin-5B (C(1))-methyltransferase [Nitrospiraceae bacterium]